MTDLPPAAVLVVSDRVARGEARDESGAALRQALHDRGFSAVAEAVVADEVETIAAELHRLARDARLILTTGGTGLGPRDRTPEATLLVADYQVPGLAEEIRRVGRATAPNAILSRGLAAVLGSTLVLNLPGSPGGAVESFEAVADVLPHALRLLAGDTGH
jgi:molybdopterin adenylyltransferase